MAHGRALNQVGEVPGRQKPWQLRLQSDPVTEQDDGAGTGRGWIERRENVIALGPSGTGKTHIALALGLAACQKGLLVAFVTAASLVHKLMEARDEKRLMRLRRQLAKVKRLIIPSRQIAAQSPAGQWMSMAPSRWSKIGTELLFELISQRYERGSTLITSKLPFEEWTETFATERLTGALLDRLTNHVNILETNGES